MMKVIADGTTYKVGFRHLKMTCKEIADHRSISNDTALRCGNSSKPRMVTSCEIWDLESGMRLVGSWVAVCNPKDQFSKSMGRLVSLGRALKHSRLPEETRQLIEARYHQVIQEQRERSKQQSTKGATQ